MPTTPFGMKVTKTTNTQSEDEFPEIADGRHLLASRSRSVSQIAAPTVGPISVPAPPITVWMTSCPDVSSAKASGGM